MAYNSNKVEFDKKLDRVIKNSLWRVTGNSVPVAQEATPVRTGTAQGSIQAKEPQQDGTRWIGEFGSYNVDYFIWLEIGTRYMTAHHMLQRAADQEFPNVFKILQEEWKKAA